MPSGYLSRSATNTEGMTYEALLYCKTNIGGYFFDGFIDDTINSELEVTSNPVETGVAVTDHAYLKPRQIVMNVKMSDVHQSLVPGQFTGGWSRSVTAFEILQKMQSDRIPVSVVVRLGIFQNIIIQKLVAKNSADTYAGLNVEVTLTELPVARVKTVEISSAEQTTGSTNGGNLQAVDTTIKEDESLLYQLGFDPYGLQG